MNRIYRFAIKLDDLLSSPAMRMGRAYSSILARMEQNNRRFSGTVGTISGGFRRAIQSVDQLRRGLLSLPSRIGLSVDTSGITRAKNEINGLRDAQGRLRDSRGRFVSDGRSNGGGRNWLSGMGLGGFGMGGLVGGYLGWQGLMMAGGATLAPAMAAERNTFSTGIMLKSPERAADLDNQYRQYAKLNPVLGYKDVQAAGTQLVGLEEKFERIMPIVKMMSDVSVGSNNNLKDVMMILGQVKMKGRLQAEEGLQFAERRINLMPYLAKALGKKTTDLPDLMKDGQISYENVLRAFNMMTAKGGIFEGMSERVGKETTEGKWNTLKEDFEQRFMDLGTKLLPTLNKAMDWFNRFTNQLEGPFTKAFQFASGQMSTFTRGTHDLFVALGIIEEKGTVTEGVVKILAGTIGALGVAAKITGDFLSGFAAFVDQVMGLFRSIFNFPRDPVGALSGKYWKAEAPTPAAQAKVETPEETYRRQGRMFRKVEDPNFDPAYMKKLAEANLKLSDGNRAYQSKMDKIDARREARRHRLGEDKIDTTGLLGSGDLQQGRKKKGVGESAGLEATVSGSKSTNITINLKSLAGDIHVHSATLKEGLAEVRDMVIDELTRVINSANAIPS